MRHLARGVIVGLVVLAGCGKPDNPPAASGLPSTTSTVHVEHPPPTRPPSTTTTTTRAVSMRAQAVAPSDDVWYLIAMCETGGKMDNPNTGNGYYGFFQFDLSSWQGAGGGPGLPSDYSYEQQKEVAIRWQQMVGWGAWPTCRRVVGV